MPEETTALTPAGDGPDATAPDASVPMTAAPTATTPDAPTSESRTPETVEELRARLDELLNDPLDEWAANMHFGGGAHYVADFESTLSWRVTRPLRAARTFQIRVGQLGLPGAVQHSIRYAQRRFGGRSR
ncbi:MULTISPECIES: hypothetical protein [unclassified Rathayibacter]|uniref:hypothetical protein n=1 Tax=unclassified Rathayibacter TaxID=2609250 RepID=UPI001045D752|nr:MULTISPECIES: hypothetical protein [unclassified Rathayibacter]MCJ1682227.1 hypothetical protein [Rathayibacter sp. VKM Ac-2928]MCJ1704796.1 hypothetical protein [Rathayibacter sp. VKM Ac-2926]